MKTRIVSRKIMRLLIIAGALMSASISLAESASWDGDRQCWMVTKNSYTWYFQIEGAGASIVDISPIPSGGTLTIPSFLADYPVTEFWASSLCRGCFEYMPKPLTGITFPSTLRVIGDGALGFQTQLSRLTIPASVEYIGDWAFYGLSSCVITFEGPMPETDGEIFGDGEYHPLPACVYFKSGSGWEQGAIWNGVRTLREGSKFVTIRFDGNGGAVRSASQRVLSGNLWGKMQTPIRNGQMFVGWYTSARGGSLITASSEVPARDTTYYAHWAPILSLGASADGSGFNWSSDSWHGQSVETHDGTDACRSGSICDNGSTYLQTAVDGPGTISFWWKVSCEGGGNDALRFLVDGSQREVITGESGWRYVSVSVTGNGTHRLKWNYTKDGSVTKGQDCGWIDQVQWTDNKVRIYFNGNGGSVRSDSTRALPGNLWGKMQTPVRYGQMFVGWYTSPSGGSLVSSSSAVPSYSTTYYAHWTPILSLGASGDTSLPLSSDSWHGQNVDTHDGRDAIRSGSICDGQSTWLKTTVSGEGTLSFWWRVSCEGTGHDALRLLVDGQQREMITGEIGWTHVSVPVYGSGTHEIKWNYTKNSSVTKGQDCGWVDQIQWESGLPFDAMSMAMDTDCTFESSGNADWTVWGTDAYYGSSCLKSGSVSDGQSSVVRTSYYSMGGYVYFYWKVSSESGYDKLHFYVDNSEVGTAISGETSWQLQYTYLSVGWHTLEWRYTKDGSVSRGQDCGWIDYLH